MCHSFRPKISPKEVHAVAIKCGIRSIRNEQILLTFFKSVLLKHVKFLYVLSPCTWLALLSHFFQKVCTS